MASYCFYGAWDWRFLSLIFISSLADFIIGLQLAREEEVGKRRLWLFGSLFVNIGFLAFFKYFNFFLESFTDVFTLFGASFSGQRLNIILPVGISFYTFQTLSYTLDIYYKKIEPTKNALAFFAFVSFFPQLVAGPIERAKDLLPQFFIPHKPDYNQIRLGVVQIVVGLFKKIVIADRLAVFVNTTYGNLDDISGMAMTFSVIFFAFQLYLDFSAYSDIAIGAANTLGFKLSTNFRRPYLATSFSGFWSRWHISLSTWFRDYLYIPLGGNRGSASTTTRNVMIVFFISGLWHGASWNFAIWGVLNGLFLVFLDRTFIKVKGMGFLKALAVAALWSLSLIFFRAETLSEALLAFSKLGFNGADLLFEYGLNQFEFLLACGLLVLVLLLEVLEERSAKLINWTFRKPLALRYAFYLLLICAILLFGSYGIGVSDNSFIYFQF